jgi:hypothetical protein
VELESPEQYRGSAQVMTANSLGNRPCGGIDPVRRSKKEEQSGFKKTQPCFKRLERGQSRNQRQLERRMRSAFRMGKGMEMGVRDGKPVYIVAVIKERNIRIMQREYNQQN